MMTLRNKPTDEVFLAEPCFGLFFSLLIVAQWYVYNDIHGGVELLPLTNLRKLRKSKFAAISQGQTIN